MKYKGDTEEKSQFRLLRNDKGKISFPDLMRNSGSESRLSRFMQRSDNLIELPIIGTKVDFHLAGALEQLNSYGYITCYSCHGSHLNHLKVAYIVFDKGIEIPVEFLNEAHSLGMAIEYSPDWNDGVILSNLYRTTIRSSRVNRVDTYSDPSDLLFLNARFFEWLERLASRLSD